MCAFYRHLFLEDTPKARVTQKIAPPNCVKKNYLLPGLQMPKFSLWLVKTLSCDVSVSIIFYVKHCQVMVIRRGDVTDIAWDFVRLEMNCLITYQTGDMLIISHHHIITNFFDKPQTKSGHL